LLKNVAAVRAEIRAVNSRRVSEFMCMRADYSSDSFAKQAVCFD
jgi:hypothetical protein